MKEIGLYGAGGHCFAVLELIRSLEDYQPNVVFDDAPGRSEVLGVPVKSASEYRSDIPLCISVGDNHSRMKIALEHNGDCPSFVHSSAVVYPSASIGKGTVVFPHVVVDAAAHVGDFCIINNNATLSHHVSVSDYCHIAINAAVAGGVSIDEGCLIGAGSIILPNVRIGKWAVVGAGAVVTQDVPDYALVVGQPAIIKKYQQPK
ncbi:MAG: acetyltransferase [Bacteroidota bacterium]